LKEKKKRSVLEFLEKRGHTLKEGDFPREKVQRKKERGKDSRKKKLSTKRRRKIGEKSLMGEGEKRGSRRKRKGT